MNPIDIAFLLVMIYGVYKGAKSGFIHSILTFGKFAIAIFLALRFSSIVAKILTRLLKVPADFSPLLGFLLVFVFVLGALFVLASTLEFFIDSRKIGSMNKYLGIAFWLLLLTFGFSVVLYLSEKGQLIADVTTQTSYVYEYVRPISETAYCKLQDTALPAIGSVIQSFKQLLSTIGDIILGRCA